MPIEIRELIIKATVDPSSSGKGSEAASGNGSLSQATPGEDLIKNCVEQVLAIIKEKHER